MASTMRSVPVSPVRDRPPSRAGADAPQFQHEGRASSGGGDSSWRDTIDLQNGMAGELGRGVLASTKSALYTVWTWMRWLAQIMLDTEHEEHRQKGYAPVQQSQVERWRNKLIRAGVLMVAALLLFWLFCRLFGGTPRKRGSGSSNR